MKASGASLMKDGGKQFERGLRGRGKLHEEASNGWKRRQVGEESCEKKKIQMRVRRAFFLRGVGLLVFLFRCD